MSQKFDMLNWVWKLSFVFSGLFFFAAIMAYYFQEVIDFTIFGRVTKFPYRPYAFPFCMCGFVFLFIGIVTLVISFRESQGKGNLTNPNRWART
jgi:hypothetical protein